MKTVTANNKVGYNIYNNKFYINLLLFYYMTEPLQKNQILSITKYIKINKNKKKNIPEK